jgi:hypothetical protein
MTLEHTTEWYPITVPSKGLLYGDRLPGGGLKISPWTVAQEDAIARNSEGEQKDLTAELLRTNVAWPEGFTYEDLLLTDQYFILLNLRMISYLDFMTLPHQCPSCGAIEGIEVKLGEIMVKTAEDTDPEEPYSVFLPRRKVKVELRQQRVGDLTAAEKYLQSSLTTVPERRRAFLYARQIVAIDGQQVPFDERLKFVSTLAIIDLKAIGNKVEKHATGIQGRYSVECSKCKSLDKEWVPEIHADFFRPRPTDIERAIQLAETD